MNHSQFNHTKVPSYEENLEHEICKLHANAKMRAKP